MDRALFDGPSGRHRARRKAIRVQPVTVGVQKFIVFETSGTPLHGPTVTAYDRTGHVVGSLP
jgi:hypothetical protein